MNTQSNAVSESSLHSTEVAPAAVSAWRLMYWSIQRELWENRSIYIAPLAAATVFLIGFAISMLSLRRRVGASPLDPMRQQHLFTSRYELSAALIMGTVLIVGFFYSLDALYGERRDRSILFWKSLPVSDLIAVLSKLTIPLLILPLLSFVITLATQFLDLRSRKGRVQLLVFCRVAPISFARARKLNGAGARRERIHGNSHTGAFFKHSGPVDRAGGGCGFPLCSSSAAAISGPNLI